jgi:hypothetical protein
MGRGLRCRDERPLQTTASIPDNSDADRRLHRALIGSRTRVMSTDLLLLVVSVHHVASPVRTTTQRTGRFHRQVRAMQSITVADVGSSARSREEVPALTFRHVDVFADTPYRGNGLIVVFCPTLDYRAEQLRTLIEEMRQ